MPLLLEIIRSVKSPESMKIAIVHAESVFHLLKTQQLNRSQGMYGEEYSFSLSRREKESP